MGVSIAERLARAGHRVILVTPMREIAGYMVLTGEMVHMRPLMHQLGIELWLLHTVHRANPGVVIGSPSYDGNDIVEWPADAVVLVTQRLPNQALFRAVIGDTDALASTGVTQVHRIGDCLSPRMVVADAIFDGQRLGREIDSAEPAVARPYIRERRVLGTTDAEFEQILEPRTSAGAAAGWPAR
jgi:dimethylamine/trimethylamine dehydrogenase